MRLMGSQTARDAGFLFYLVGDMATLFAFFSCVCACFFFVLCKVRYLCVFLYSFMNINSIIITQQHVNRSVL